MTFKWGLCAALMLASGGAMAECRQEGNALVCDLPGISPGITVPPKCFGCVPTVPAPGTIPAVGDRSWHLLTQTYGGTITLLRDLTKHECEFAMHRAKGEPATEEEIIAARNRVVTFPPWEPDNGEIKTAECFQ
jgi:hypothetical protein